MGIRFKCIPYCCGLQQNNTADEQEQVGKQVGNFIVQDLKIQILALSMLYSTGNFVLLRWCQGQDAESTKVSSMDVVSCMMVPDTNGGAHNKFLARGWAM